MARALIRFLHDNNIDGDVHSPHEPIYRRAEGSTYLEPDMMYVSNELARADGTKRTSADIVFEYLSRSTSVYDRTTKADTYLALGVRELWLVDPVTVTIEVRHASKLTKHRFGRSSNTHAASMRKSRVLDGWEVSVDELFEGSRLNVSQFRPCLS